MNRTRSALAAVLAVALTVLTPTAAQAESPSNPAGHSGVLAWSRFDNFEDGTARIVAGDPRGGSARVLSHPATGSQDIDPKISPDGRRVLFERDTDGQPSVAGIVGVRGDGERVLPLPCDDLCAGVADPVWAPDGRHVVFSRVIGPFDAVNNSAR